MKTAQAAPSLKAVSTLSRQRLPREQRDTLFLLAVIAWIIFPLLWHLPPWSSLAAFAALAWRGWLAWNGRSLPSRWVLIALTAAALCITVASYRTIFGSGAGVALVTMLLAAKTLEARARRDAMVIFFLGFFTLLCNFLHSQSLATALAMLLGVFGLLTALINAHIPSGHPSLRYCAVLALRCMAWGTPIMLVLFLFFPRLSPLWGMPTDQITGRTGLSGQLRIGAIAELSQDTSVALRLKINTPDGRPLRSSQMYFRGPVLGLYDGSTWRMREGAWGMHLQPSSAQHPARLETRGTPLPYEITIEPTQRRWLTLLEATPAVVTRPDSDWRAFMLPDLQWQTNAPLRDTLRLSLQAYPDFRHGPLSWTAQLQQDLLLPGRNDPRTRAWGEELREQVERNGTQAVVQQVLQHLRQGDYTYTLEPGEYGSDPSDEFWFDRKQGFCEHIAAAFVVLMRASGVPARIVTGFQGGEINPVDGYWTVRNSDAHAWAEIWIDDEGWVRVDPTGAIAPSRIEALERLSAPLGAMGNLAGNVISPSLLIQLRNFWEAADNRWTQWVLNYTQSRQFDLLRSLGWQNPNTTDLLRLSGALVSTIALLTGGWLWRARRQTNPWRALMAQARTQWQRSSGTALPPQLTPRQWAQEALRQHGDAAQPWAQWLLRMEQWRYAPQASRNETLRVLRRELRTLRWPPASRGN